MAARLQRRREGEPLPLPVNASALAAYALCDECKEAVGELQALAYLVRTIVSYSRAEMEAFELASEVVGTVCAFIPAVDLACAFIVIGVEGRGLLYTALAWAGLESFTYLVNRGACTLATLCPPPTPCAPGRADKLVARARGSTALCSPPSYSALLALP
jgi:hypothetical protein